MKLEDAELLDEYTKLFGEVGSSTPVSKIRSFLKKQHRGNVSIQDLRGLLYSVGYVTELKGDHLVIVQDGFAYNPDLHS